MNMNRKDRQLLFSVTKKDFDIQTFRSGGKGGQNQNKVESGVRIIHRASGAVGESRRERDQIQNKKIAFRHLINTSVFKAWMRMHTAAVLKGIGDIEKELDKEMDPDNLKIETYTPRRANQ